MKRKSRLFNVPCYHVRFILSALICFILFESAFTQEENKKPEASKPSQELFSPEVSKAVGEGLKFLAQQQQRSGGIGKNAQMATTSLAGLAFLAGGNTMGRGKYAKYLKDCVEFILKNQNENGYFYNASDSQSRMHGHGFALMFLAEAYGMSKPSPGQRGEQLEEMKKALHSAVDLAVISQSPEGGWDYEPSRNNREHEGSITVCIVEGLRAARNAGIHVPKKTIDKAVEYMKKSWDGQSSFQYKLGQEGLPSFALAGAGACVLIASGESSRDVLDMIDGAVNFVKQSPAGTGKESAHRFWYYGYFYATQALHYQGGQAWIDWYRDISRHLLQKQVAVAKGACWESPSQEAGGDRAYGTAVALLILQMPNEYLPIFQK